MQLIVQEPHASQILEDLSVLHVKLSTRDELCASLDHRRPLKRPRYCRPRLLTVHKHSSQGAMHRVCVDCMEPGHPIGYGNKRQIHGTAIKCAHGQRFVLYME